MALEPLGRHSSLRRIEEALTRFGPLDPWALGHALVQHCERGDPQTARRLLELGADPRFVDDLGRDALMSAALGGNLDLAHLLLPLCDADRQALATEEPSQLHREGIGESALMLAAASRNAAIASLLATPRRAAAATSDGWTALSYAVASGAVDALRILLPMSDANRFDSDGATPLMDACRAGREEIVDALLPWCDPLARAPSGQTASDIARSMGRDDLAARVEGFALARQERSALGEIVASASAPATTRRAGL